MTEEGKELCPLRVPFNLGLVGKELLVRDCSFFSSFTCPLRLVFSPPDEDASTIDIMFKVSLLIDTIPYQLSKDLHSVKADRLCILNILQGCVLVRLLSVYRNLLNSELPFLFAKKIAS